MYYHLLLEADRKFRLLDYDGTMIVLESAVAQNPYSAEALVMRAKFRKTFGMQALAEEDIRQANQINPLAAYFFGYYGQQNLTEILSFEPEKALKELTTFQKMDYYYQALDQLIMDGQLDSKSINTINETIEDIEFDRLSDALARVDEFILTSPQLAITQDLKGVILRKQGKFDQSVDAFSKAVVLDPSFAIAWYNFALTQQSLGEYDIAQTYLNRALELQSNLSKAYFDRAMLMKRIGKKEAAIEDYDKAMDLNGEIYMDALLNRGLTKKMVGDYTGALEDLNNALTSYPDNAELLKNRGNLHLLLGLPRKAIDDYTQAIRLNNQYAEAYYNRAMAHYILYDKVSGCFDLKASLNLGYEPAANAMEYFCTQY